jgi:hypothetical protein
MKKFKIEVPFSETVYGTVTYVVIADTKEEAEALLERDKGEYYYDTYNGYIGYAENYEEHWDDAEWEEQE